MPRFERLWERHVERWPRPPDSEKDGGRREGDPAGSWRSDGGRYLSPEDNKEADRLIGLLRAPEEAITKDLQRIERENPHGGALVGLKYRLKGEERLKEKLADGMQKELGSSVADAVTAISDAVRYTYCFSLDAYASGVTDIVRQLESAGYRMAYGKNHWLADPQYKGINTRWVTPAGDRFELQFHTDESFHAKEHLTHRSYERLRSQETSHAERQELRIFQRTVSGAVPEPSGVRELLNQ